MADLSNSTTEKSEKLELENVSTEGFEPIDPATTSSKENDGMCLQPPQPVNIINTSSTKAGKSKEYVVVDDDCYIYEFNEPHQLNGPTLNEVKQDCEKAKESVQSIANDSRYSISLIPLPGETTVKAISTIRVRKDLIDYNASKKSDFNDYDDWTISKYYEALQLNGTVFGDVKQSCRKASVRNAFHDITYSSTANNIVELLSSEEETTMKPMSENSSRISTHTTHGVYRPRYRQNKEQIPFNSKFMRKRRYKHTYFDSDGNVIESNPKKRNSEGTKKSGWANAKNAISH